MTGAATPVDAATRDNARLRILLVTYCFPPMNSIASHRPYGWARAWRDLGHEVHVLTPVKRVFDGPMDLQLDLSGIAVHEVPCFPAGGAGQPPEAGAPAGRLARWERFKTLTRRARFGLALFGDPRLAAHFALAREGTRLARAVPFDFIAGTTPPEVSLFAARAISRRSGVPWVADYRDLWFHDMRYSHWRAASWLSGLVHRRLARSAAALVTVSAGLQRRLSSFLGREVLLSYNGYLEAADRGTVEPWPDGRLHIVYTGRVYPGYQDPQPLFRALRALQREVEGASRIAVDFYGHENPWLRELVMKHGLEDCVRLHGHVPHRESLARQHAADALLFLDWNDTGEGVLTGKLFEYLGSGRPILSIGARADTEAAALISRTGSGVTLGTDEEIAAYIGSLRRGAPAGSPGDRRPLSRERQARALLEALQARLNLAGRPGRESAA